MTLREKKVKMIFFFFKLYKSFQIKVIMSFIDIKSVNDFGRN